MGKIARTRQSDRGKIITTEHREKKIKLKRISQRNPKSYYGCLYANATVDNYGTIARGLGIKIGPNVPPLVDQLSFKGFKVGFVKQLCEDFYRVNHLYQQGYEVETLYAQIVKRLQKEIIDGLPF